MQDRVGKSQLLWCVLGPQPKEQESFVWLQEPLAVQPASVAGSGHTPEALASALMVSCGLGCRANACTEYKSELSFLKPHQPRGSSMESLLENRARLIRVI